MPKASPTQHLQAAQYCQQAFRAAYGRDPSRDELRYALCEALHDTTYGLRWKEPGAGSYNIGAIQTNKSWTGDTFQFVDHHADGTEYPQKFRKYPTPEAGWADFIHEIYQRRKAVLAAVQAPNEYYRVHQGNVTATMTDISVKKLHEFYPRLGSSFDFYSGDRACLAVLEQHAGGKLEISLVWHADKPRAFATAMIATQYYESFGANLEERIVTATTAMRSALNEIDAVPVVPLDVAEAPTAPLMSTEIFPSLGGLRILALFAVAVGVGVMVYKRNKTWQTIQSAEVGHL